MASAPRDYVFDKTTQEQLKQAIILVKSENNKRFNRFTNECTRLFPYSPPITEILELPNQERGRSAKYLLKENLIRTIFNEYHNCPDFNQVMIEILASVRT